MSDPLATATDVADIWRPLSTAEQTQATNLIVKASAMLRAAAPYDVDARLALAPTDPNHLDAVVVAAVVAGVVKRVMLNPDSAVTTSETVGPYSKSTTFAQRNGRDDVLRGDLAITAEDLAMLRRATASVPAAFTIRTRTECPVQSAGVWPP